MYSEHGVDRLSYGHQTVEERIQTLRSWVEFVAASQRPNAVFMDTTTLYAAWALRLRRSLSAELGLQPRRRP